MAADPPGVHPHMQWHWVLLLVMSRYISDPDIFSPPSCPSSILSLQATDYCDLLLGSSKARSLYWGGGGCGTILHSHTNTQSHWSRESTVFFPPRVAAVRALGGAAVRALGVHPHLQWNWVLLFAMSRYSMHTFVKWRLTEEGGMYTK